MSKNHVPVDSVILTLTHLVSYRFNNLLLFFGWIRNHDKVCSAILSTIQSLKFCSFNFAIKLVLRLEKDLCVCDLDVSNARESTSCWIVISKSFNIDFFECSPLTDGTPTSRLNFSNVFINVPTLFPIRIIAFSVLFAPNPSMAF